MSVYLDVASYTMLVATCAADLPTCPWTGGLDVERAKRELGEAFNVWPETIQEDAARHGHL